ncbi:MAG: hypothetical protein AB7U62_10050 [Pseudolabrys sp.]
MSALVAYDMPMPTESGGGDRGIPVAWNAHPLGDGPSRLMIAPAGTTIEQIVLRAMLVDPDLPDDFDDTGAVKINGELIPRDLWPFVRPRRDAGRPVYVTLHVGLHGGNGNSGGSKNPLATIVQVVALVAAFVIMGPAAGAFAGLGGAGIWAFGVTLAGSLAAAALSHPPTLPAADQPLLTNQSATQLGQAGASGNVLARDASLPYVAGRRRIALPFGANPYVEIKGDDQVVEALWVAAAPMELSDARLGDVPLEDMLDGIEYEIGEGRPGDPGLTLITRQTATDELGIEASRPKVSPDDGSAVESQQYPENAKPQWHGMFGRRDPDEIAISLVFPEGALDLNSPTAAVAIPMRMRFRRRGDTLWTQAPEIHFHFANQRPTHKYVKLKWQAPRAFISQAPTSDAPYLAYKKVPGQTATPPTAGWEADPYFSAGAGNDVMSAANFNAHFVRGVALNQDGIELYLDPAIFPRGEYQIEMMFGTLYTVSTFSPNSYLISAGVYDLFGYYLAGAVYRIPRTRASVRDRVRIDRIASIWNESPIGAAERVAFIAIRATNRQLGELTVEGASLVPDYDGAEWTGLVATRNPAPHVRRLFAKHYPDELIGDTALIAWRQYCIDRGYEVAAVLQQGSVLDGLNLVASAGKARPRMSEVFDVLVDRDTSAEGTVQSFSARNVRGFKFQCAFPDIPGGFRVIYGDRDRGHRETPIIVRNPRVMDLSKPLEEMRNEAQDTEAAVTARALFDMAQATERMAFYQFDVPAIGMRCRRGDLISVTHDLLEQFVGFARILKVRASGGMITGLLLDGTIPTPANQAWANAAAAWSNYSAAWKADRLGVCIRLRDRSEIVAEIVAAGDELSEITFVTPFADPGPKLEPGCHVVSGPLGRERERMKLISANYKSDLEWTLTCVDEANQIHEAWP